MKRNSLFLSLLLFLCSTAFAQIPTNGLVGHWSFNNNDGTDAVGLNNATLVGTTGSADRFGNTNKAMYLDCSPSSYINLGTSDTLKPNQATISIWVNVDTACLGGSGYAYNPVIITKNQTGSSFFEAYAMYYNQSRQPIAITTQPPTNEKYYVSSTQGNFDVWHHLVMSYDNDSLKFYFNGVLESTVYKGFSSVFLAGDSVMVGNSANTQNNRFLNASVDDIRIYNRVLSFAEVMTLYNEADPNLPSNLHNINATTNHIEFFPNPNQGQVQFNANANIEQIEVFNLAGQRLHSITPNTAQGRLELNLENGLYLLRSRFSDGTVNSSKIVLQR
jgi:hypothetical protein